jgi:hypothetical protein
MNKTCFDKPKKLTSRFSVFLEKLTVAQLLKKFSAFYGNRKFITLFIRGMDWIDRAHNRLL